MKIRAGFVSNSSSTSFYIYNKTIEPLPLIEFVRENIHLVDWFNREYDWHNFTHEEALAAVKCYDYVLQPGQNVCDFGDEEGNTLGTIFDYALRSGGSSKRFGWCLNEYLR